MLNIFITLAKVTVRHYSSEKYNINLIMNLKSNARDL